MLAGLAPWMLLLIAAIVFTGGLVKGIAGFGYALASTAVLATLLSPSMAVALMVVPVLAANLSLARELDPGMLHSCLDRFRLYLMFAVAGTVLGTFLIARIPVRPFRVALGLLALAFVALQRLDLGSNRELADDGIASAVVGAVSGFVFGLSNVGVQFVLYLESRDLDRSLFVAVLAVLMVGVSVVRLGIVMLSELSAALVLLSVLMAVPGVLGTAVGTRLRSRFEEATVERFVLAILVLAGLKLVLGGVGAV